jgi:hypothetical protein
MGQSINQSIELRGTLRVGDRCPSSKVGWQRLRNIGRAETLESVELFPMYSRVPTESQIYTCAGNRYFESPKRIEPVIGLFAVTAAFSR